MSYDNIMILELMPLLSKPSTIELSGNGEHIAVVVWDGKKLKTVGPIIQRETYLRFNGNVHIDGRVVLDIEGVNFGTADFAGLKRSIETGGPYWVEAGVRDIGDLFDVITLSPEMTMIGTMGLKGHEMMKEAIEISNSCIPLIYASNNEAVFHRFRLPLGETIREMGDIGFESCVVLDLESLGKKINRTFWSKLSHIIEIVPCGGILLTDVPFLSREGYSTAIVEPSLPQEKSNSADWCIDTACITESPRAKGRWVGI